MKNIIPFSKDIKFNTKIYELISISLENTLMVEDNEINGEFIVSGEYKMSDASLITEPFIYSLPFNISINNDYDTDTIKIDIYDFKYEIINEEILRVNIEVIVQGDIKEEITPDVIIDKNDERKEIKMEENLFQEETKVQEVAKEDKLIENIDLNDEQYVSYYVHIVRENDTIESICNMYNIDIDKVKEYNNIDKIILGNKIIIPNEI